MHGEKPTLRDVAARAGVSLGTASNVLNNRGNVSDDTRQRVIKAAAYLGYLLQPRASSKGGLTVIGVIGKMTGGEPMNLNVFYSYVLAGIERECQQQQLSVMFANIEVDHINRPMRLPPMLLDRQVDGVLIVGAFLESTIHLIGSRVDFPVVLVDGYAPGSGFDSVVTDNLNGAFAAVEHLIRAGHTRIGLVGCETDGYPSVRERRKGYLRALKHHRIDQDYIEESALTRQGGCDGALALLSRSPEVTAIFACNDEVAQGVYEAAEQLGRAIPQDLSVIGFDDIDYARALSPALTTMRVDKMLLGMLAVRHLKDRAENPIRPSLSTSVSAVLIPRDSVFRLAR